MAACRTRPALRSSFSRWPAVRSCCCTPAQRTAHARRGLVDQHAVSKTARAVDVLGGPEPRRTSCAENRRDSWTLTQDGNAVCVSWGTTMWTLSGSNPARPADAAALGPASATALDTSNIATHCRWVAVRGALLSTTTVRPMARHRWACTAASISLGVTPRRRSCERRSTPACDHARYLIAGGTASSSSARGWRCCNSGRGSTSATVTRIGGLRQVENASCGLRTGLWITSRGLGWRCCPRADTR